MRLSMLCVARNLRSRPQMGRVLREMMNDVFNKARTAIHARFELMSANYNPKLY